MAATRPATVHPWPTCSGWLWGLHAAHTERKATSCSSGLIKWLIGPKLLYPFTIRFEIQHCTWGAMCVLFLSPFINLCLPLSLYPPPPLSLSLTSPSLSRSLTPAQTFCISDSNATVNGSGSDVPQVGLISTSLFQVPIWTQRHPNHQPTPPRTGIKSFPFGRGRGASAILWFSEMMVVI